MNGPGPISIEKEMAGIKAQNRRLAIAVGATLFLWSVTVVCVIVLIHRGKIETAPQGISDILRTRTLVVIDDHGTERVRIGAPLPEPIIMGQKKKRDDSIAGILLYDKLGNERGGYVTDNSVGNALLTLDSNVGQEFTLVAYPNGGAEFGINDDQKNAVSLSALESGPRLQLRKRGQVVFEQPQSESVLHPN
jgi:hypothetical protein